MAQQITAAPGTNLFALAAQYLGDATQWIRIAQANNLADPVIYAVGSLTVPDADPTLTGGIPQSQ
jgi:hypothetical protein